MKNISPERESGRERETEKAPSRRTRKGDNSRKPLALKGLAGRGEGIPPS